MNESSSLDSCFVVVVIDVIDDVTNWGTLLAVDTLADDDDDVLCKDDEDDMSIRFWLMMMKRWRWKVCVLAEQIETAAAATEGNRYKLLQDVFLELCLGRVCVSRRDRREEVSRRSFSLSLFFVSKMSGSRKKKRLTDERSRCRSLFSFFLRSLTDDQEKRTNRTEVLVVLLLHSVNLHVNMRLA